MTEFLHADVEEGENIVVEIPRGFSKEKKTDETKENSVWSSKNSSFLL